MRPPLSKVVRTPYSRSCLGNYGGKWGTSVGQVRGKSATRNCLRFATPAEANRRPEAWRDTQAARRAQRFFLEGQATNVEIEAGKLALSMVERLQRESFELPERLLDLPGALLDTLIASSTHLWCSGGVSERSRIARGGSGKLSSTLRGGAGRPETAILELFG